jgi:hypothetical protein
MYSLCDQTVTVYRLTDGDVQRQVLEGCFYRWEDGLQEDAAGVHHSRRFLLIQPGDTQRVQPGDRIFPGVGPEVDAGAWARFIPALVPGLGEAAYAVPRFFGGELVHTEAGRG